MAREMTRGEIDELLASQFVVRLGCHAGGDIYVVPVAYAWDGSAIVAFSYEGRKLTMMRTAPAVCVEVDAVVHFGSWRSVIGWGVFEELSGDERERAKAILASRLTPLLQDDESRTRMSRAMADDPSPVVFRIHLDRVSGRIEQ